MHTDEPYERNGEMITGRLSVRRGRSNIITAGMPVIWRLANAKLGEREVTQALLEGENRLVHEGQVILGDKGFAGRDFEDFITNDLGTHLNRPDRKDKKPRFGKFEGIRQWIESIFDTLKGQLGLEQHGGRTMEGVYARVASKFLALAAGNRRTRGWVPVSSPVAMR